MKNLFKVGDRVILRDLKEVKQTIKSHYEGCGYTANNYNYKIIKEYMHKNNKEYLTITNIRTDLLDIDDKALCGGSQFFRFKKYKEFELEEELFLV